MKITKALIIKSPHIDNILSGEKTWEMRSEPTKILGPIALIQAGSKTIVGVAELIDARGPFSKEELLANQSKHLMTPERINDPEASQYVYAWVLTDAKRLSQPVPYKHKSQVKWVNLDEETSAAVMKAAA